MCILYYKKNIWYVSQLQKKPNLQIMCLRNKKLVFKTWVTTGFSIFLQLPGKNGMAVEHVVMKNAHSMLKTIRFSLLFPSSFDTISRP